MSTGSASELEGVHLHSAKLVFLPGIHADAAHEAGRKRMRDSFERHRGASIPDMYTESAMCPSTLQTYENAKADGSPLRAWCTAVDTGWSDSKTGDGRRKKETDTYS